MLLDAIFTKVINCSLSLNLLWITVNNRFAINAIKKNAADVTSFDGGYGSAYLAKMVGQKKAREIFFLGRNYSVQEAYDMGMDEYLYSGHWCFIEWAEKIPNLIPQSHSVISIRTLPNGMRQLHLR